MIQKIYMQKKLKKFALFAIIFVLSIIAASIFFLGKKEPSRSGNVNSAEIGQVYTSVKQFYDSISNDGGKGMLWANFDRHQDVYPVSLNKILLQDGSISSEGEAFIHYMSQQDFDVFCYKGGSVPSCGIYMSFAHLENYSGNSYEDALTKLDAWSPHMLKDLRGVLFPQDPLSVEDANQYVQFGKEYSLATDLGLKYKSSEVTIGAEKREIYYGVVDGYVVLTTLKEGLFEASRELFSLVP